MQEVCRGGGGKDTSFDGFGFYLSHGFLYCRVQGLAEVNTKVFDMFWSFYTHGVETLNHLCRCVDAQGSCFGDVDVEATDFSIFVVCVDNWLYLLRDGDGEGELVVIGKQLWSSLESIVCLIHDFSMFGHQGSVEGLGGQKKEDAGERVTLSRTVFDGDEESLSPIDFDPGISNQCVLMECLHNGFWDAKGPECLYDDFMSNFVKSFFNVEADELKRLVPIVGFLDEVCGDDGWFLDPFLWHEAMLMVPNEFG